jgi:hypothetical protein
MMSKWAAPFSIMKLRDKQFTFEEGAMFKL